MIWARGPNLFACRNTVVLAHKLKGLFFPHWTDLIRCQKSLSHRCKSSLLESEVACVSILLPVPHSFCYFNFVVTFETGKFESSSSIFLFHHCLVAWGHLQFRMNFRIMFSTSAKGAVGILLGLWWTCISLWVTWTSKQY